MPSFNPSSLPDLTGKVFLVTGGNAGIGYQTVLQLARKHACVYIGCRSESKGNTAISNIQAIVPYANIELLTLDHMDLASVLSAAQSFRARESKLHGLITNAGIMATPFEKSKDGYEAQWQTNYLSHFLLTYHLLPILLSTARSSKPGDVRIVTVTSGGHANFAPKTGIEFHDINQERGGVWSRYGQSKLANILHAKELNRLYGPDGIKREEQGEIWTAAVNPGNVYTDLNKNASFFGLNGVGFSRMLNALGVYISAEKGSYTSVFCAASAEIKREDSGDYFVPLAKVGKPSKNARDVEMATKLWDLTMDGLREKGML